MSPLEYVLVLSYLTATVRLTTPIGLAAMGGVLSERSGVFNIALEGMMLFGALTGVLGSHYWGSPWAGTAAAAGVGAVLGLLLAYLSVTLGANQIVSGVALNLFAFGCTTFLARVLLRPAGIEQVPAFQPLVVPYLADLPLIGPVLFRQTPLVYAALVLAPALTLFLFRTPWGLGLRAVGEHPRAADTAGLKVAQMRYGAVVASGMLAGTAGAFLSLGHLNLFTENMSAGRGFIALAAVIFGKWHPLGALGAALLFGAADAFQLLIQTYNLGVPYQVPVMLPYLLALLALTGLVGRMAPPAAAGTPYRAEE
ncbi:MAG: ABC transporter permease [Armatimonadota bacterium]|nr:ABC transporter permease [Armatimonadota bacterium]MDR7448558.1 ABC transporter permease [Armatimonadota bacterium]MDR7458923.1 ABC transporter permease [Armatimonadota bacterium]MDR7478930.1 ABC transporter permease [Armatimonadota bacterium]MDR7488328.1 ABC transporter permease [Armatimonadota bacterium]